MGYWRMFGVAVSLATLVGCGLVWSFEDFRAAPAKTLGDDDDDGGANTHADSGGPIKTDSTWCARDGGLFAQCWDFDRNGAVDDGWEKKVETTGTVSLTSSDRSPPHAMLGQLNPGTSSAFLRSAPIPAPRVLELEFDINLSDCATDANGTAVASVTIGDPTAPGQNAWQAHLVHHARTTPALDLAALTLENGGTSIRYDASSCATPDTITNGGDKSCYCLSSKPLTANAWQRIRLKLERQPASKEALTLLIDETTVIPEWQVSVPLQDGQSVFFLLGLLTEQSSSGACTARYDNVVLRATN
jgi:hypothetical protein